MRLSTIALVLITGSTSGCGVSFSGARAVPQETAQRTEDHALELVPGQSLTLVTGFGRIQATAGTDVSPGLHARVQAGGSTVEEARAILDRYQLRFERTSAGLRVDLVGEPLRIGGVEKSATVDFEVHVFPGTPLEARSGSGSIAARGALGALELATGFGSIAIDGARGDVEATSGSGKITAQGLQGDEIVLTSGFGSIAVETSSARRMRLETGSGAVRATSIAAALEIEADFGKIEVQDVEGAVNARSGSGSVGLRGVRGPVEASSSFGNVNVEGRIESLLASTGSGSVRVEARPGSSNVAGWKLSSGFGSVTLAVPGAFACRLDARTSFGSVECDFPVTIDAGRREGKTELRGTIGGGGGPVTLSSGSGSVHLKKL